MKKIKIPRKDHEVYFIPLPDKNTGKKMQPFITGELEKSHPAFSPATPFDFRKIRLNNAGWIMATVMEENVLAEYRILHGNAVFYTNTSALVKNKNFVNCRPVNIDDEYIGYDAVKNEPVSVPDVKEENAESPFLQKEIKRRHGVFNKKFPVMRTAFIITGTALSFLLFLNFHNQNMEPLVQPVNTEPVYFAEQANSAEPVNAEQAAGQVPETQLMDLPSPVNILAAMSTDILKAGGKIMHWNYKGDTAPLVAMRLKGLNLQRIHEICNHYDYLQLQDIHDVTYSNESPYTAINLNLSGEKYLLPEKGIFGDQGSILPAITQLTNVFLYNEIMIVSEMLPLPNISNNYRITYNAVDWNLIKSLESILGICTKNQMHISELDIRISDGGNYFTTNCSLARNMSSGFPNEMPGNEKYNITAAFGYTGIEPVTDEIPDMYLQEENSNQIIIGLIKDREGQTVFYRESGDAKIRTREDL